MKQIVRKLSVTYKKEITKRWQVLVAIILNNIIMFLSNVFTVVILLWLGILLQINFKYFTL